MSAVATSPDHTPRFQARGVNQRFGAVVALAGDNGAGRSGGRGRVCAALLGALVIGSISNGMDLLALGSTVEYVITGAVLAVAVTIDALARRRRQRVGRR
ncbi:hypothetical protein [Baekduia soli]|uniref:hypothetical protein n=1 Tax=Baekduia soli TaxID=496014 RepID=UPI001652118A